MLRDFGGHCCGNPERSARMILGEAQEVFAAQQAQIALRHTDRAALAQPDREERESADRAARPDRKSLATAWTLDLDAAAQHEHQRVGFVAFSEQGLAGRELALFEEFHEVLALGVAEIREE
jgi:hypothetical protein